MKKAITFSARCSGRDPIASRAYLDVRNGDVYVSRRQERELLRRLRAIAGDCLRACAPDGFALDVVVM